MRYLYVMAPSASRYYSDGGTITACFAAYTTRATSEEDAIRIGIRMSKRKFLIKKGWHSHQCAVLKVTIKDLAFVVAGMLVKDEKK